MAWRRGHTKIPTDGDDGSDLELYWITAEKEVRRPVREVFSLLQGSETYLNKSPNSHPANVDARSPYVDFR